MKLAICLLVALPLPAYAAPFGTQGTFLPKGGLSITYQEFPGGADQQTFRATSIGIAPELGYFLIDDLILFGSLNLHGFFFQGEVSLSVGGGLGLGYYIRLTESVGLLPSIDGLVRASRSGPVTGMGLVARARLPLVFTQSGFYFGVGPEAQWYIDPKDDPNVLSSFTVGLFTEIGGWL